MPELCRYHGAPLLEAFLDIHEIQKQLVFRCYSRHSIPISAESDVKVLTIVKIILATFALSVNIVGRRRTSGQLP